MLSKLRHMAARRRTNRLDLILPGILVAATGVGAGDLATAGLAGAKLGVGVAWAVIFAPAIGRPSALATMPRISRPWANWNSTCVEEPSGKDSSFFSWVP